MTGKKIAEYLLRYGFKFAYRSRSGSLYYVKDGMRVRVSGHLPTTKQASDFYLRTMLPKAEATRQMAEFRNFLEEKSREKQRAMKGVFK